MRAIVIPTYVGKVAKDARKTWGDLRVCLNAVDAYAADDVDEVVIAWDGPHAPDDMPRNKKFRFIERPKGLDSAQGMAFAIDQADSDEIFHVQDDSVVHPDATRMMIEDIELIQRQRPDLQLGILGARSNFICGPQNVRCSNNGNWHYGSIFYDTEGQIMETDIVFPVFAWYRRDAWEKVGRFPEGLTWWSDVLFSYDLARAGYTHFISRAYVHHIGMRGTHASGENTDSLHAAGIAWLKVNRPDFLKYLVERGFVAADDPNLVTI